jgi:large subunit ribosomal protein L6
MIINNTKFYNICSYKFIFKNIILLHFNKEKLLIIRKKNTNKFIKLNSKLNFIFLKNEILIVISNFSKLSFFEIDKLNYQKCLFISSFKENLVEIQNKFFHKLKLIGIGFKIFKTRLSNILLFRLGYSHPIFFSIKFYNVTITKETKLFLESRTYIDTRSFLGLIRKLKIPEVYKGKGIFYSNEKIFLKKGKKI